MQGISILGSTGSIGKSALAVLGRQRDAFRVVGLVALQNREALDRQAAEWKPSVSGLVSERGPELLVEAATHPDADIVLNAVVGTAGLDATLAALRAGKRVALANKETLVMAGDLVRAAMQRGGGEIVPVDSEHSAILQCIAGRVQTDVRRVVVTGSGGPFRTWERDRIQEATAEQALKHPTWQMGRKITIDSATLVNKALEVIEAHYLFDLPYDGIDVIIHPQSVVHSFVEFVDGSVLAQLGKPSMELPVLYALTHPRRLADSSMVFDPVALSPLTFEAVRHDAFPALALGISAGRRGGAGPAVYNAANEQAVQLFLDGRMRFGQIAAIIADTLDALGGREADTKNAILAADAAARAFVKERFAC